MDLAEIRQYRIFNMAIFDWVATLIGAYLLNLFLFHKFEYWKVALGTIILGIIVHKILGVRTMFNYYLGLGEKPIRN